MKKTYIRKMPRDWFLRTPGIRRFMARELTCVFILAYLISLLYFFCYMSKGVEQFKTFMETMKSPGFLAFHGIVLLGAAYHSITWFNVTPQAMPVRIGENRLPDFLCAFLMGYLPWLVVSGIVLYFTLR